jgi:hypothetical protein
MLNIQGKLICILVLVVTSCSNVKDKSSEISATDSIHDSTTIKKKEELPDTTCESLVRIIPDKFTKQNEIISKYLKSNNNDFFVEIQISLADNYDRNGKDVWFNFQILGKNVCLESKFSVYFLFENGNSIRTVGVSSVNCEGRGSVPLNGMYDGSKKILKELLTNKLKSIRIEGDKFCDFDLNSKCSIELFHTVNCIKNYK